MFKRIAPFLLSCLLAFGLLGWWVSQWPAPIPVKEVSPDALWRSISKTSKGWSVAPFQSNDKGFLSYQKGGLLLYGVGQLPSINYGDVPSISIPDGGQWIIKVLDRDARIQIKSSAASGIITGDGTIFIDTKEIALINFDIDFTLSSGDKMLPSFLKLKDRQVFFDIAEQKTVIPTDLWSLYVTFLKRDTMRALGKTNKKDIDTLIRSLLEREPESSEGILHHDLRARNALEELSTIVNKIDKGDACGPDLASCFTLVDDIINKNIDNFPEVFTPVKQAILSWIQIDTQTQQNVFTWKNIFHTYHNNIIADEPLARVIRDRSILEMVRSGGTTSHYEIWQYLTRMLADQKLGSVYSLQIMREMIRIGEELMIAKETTDTVKSTLTKTAIESLRNLRNLLENAYFTKKEYWFVLRTDLLDSEGKAIQTDTLTQDLQSLIEQIDRSTLLKGLAAAQTADSDLSVIRGQLAWFKCIFSRNAEYVANPRVCRITVSG